MKKLKKIISNVLKVSPAKINDQTSPANVKAWDSFHGLLMVTELEGRYKVRFTMEDVMAVKNVGDIKKSLRKYGVKIEE